MLLTHFYLLKIIKKMIKNLFLITILLLLTLYGKAQTNNSDSILINNINLNTIVISGNKFSEIKRESPQQILAINKKEIAFINAANTADLLSNSGNIFVQKSQMGGGSPVLRGFEANKVLIVIDGVRLNNAIYRGGHLQNVLRIDNNMLEKSEVLFGPAALMYGSDALGGVMSFYSKNPVFANNEQKINAKIGAFVRYASANQEKTIHLDYNLGGKKIAWLGSFSASKFDDLTQGAKRSSKYPDFGKLLYYPDRINNKDTAMLNPNPNKQIGTAYEQFDILQKIKFQQNNYIAHSLNIQYSNTGNVPRYDRLTELSNNTLKYAKWYYGPEKRLLASYTLNINKQSKCFDELKAVAAFQDIEESRISRRFKKDTEKTQTEKVSVFSLNIDANKNLSEKDNLQYGIEYSFNNVNSTAQNLNIADNTTSEVATRYPNAGSTVHNFALYVSNKFKINPQLILNGGLRYTLNNLNAKFENNEAIQFPYSEAKQSPKAISGSVSLVKLLGETGKISIQGASGFRSPNIDDLGKVFESTAGHVIVPNTELKPEYTYNGELGIANTFGNKFTIEAAAYYTKIINAIVTDKFTFNNSDSIEYDGEMSAVYANQNKGKAYITGVFGSLNYKINNWLSASTTLTLTNGKVNTDTTDAPLDHIPPMFGKTAITCNYKNVTIDAYSLYNAAKKIKDYSLSGEDNEQYATEDGMPAWFTLNLKTSYTFAKKYSIQAGIENILDTNYRAFASGVSAPGRNIFVALKANW